MSGRRATKHRGYRHAPPRAPGSRYRVKRRKFSSRRKSARGAEVYGWTSGAWRTAIMTDLMLMRRMRRRLRLLSLMLRGRGRRRHISGQRCIDGRRALVSRMGGRRVGRGFGRIGRRWSRLRIERIRIGRSSLVLVFVISCSRTCRRRMRRMKGSGCRRCYRVRIRGRRKRRSAINW